jgi:hypothetical protein
MTVFNGYLGGLESTDESTLGQGEPSVHPMVWLFRGPFPTASLPCYAYKYHPLRLLSCLCHSEDLQQPRREGVSVLLIWDSSSSCLGNSFLVFKGFKVHIWLSWVLRSRKLCELVTLGDWWLLDGLGVWRFLVSSWRLWEPQENLGVNGSRPTVSEMENGYS